MITSAPAKTGLRRYRLPASIAVAGGVLAAVLVAFNSAMARRANRRHPPRGAYVDVKGVRLHYLRWGTGPAVVLLHGNGSLAEDFAQTGLVASLSAHHTVIVFDRPGYGHSDQIKGPERRPEGQARLFLAALEQIGVSNAVIVGHSWGTLVALEMAVARPEGLRGLVLVSGYYHLTPRIDALLASIAGLPFLGRALSCTVLPLLCRAAWPLLVKNIFAPRAVAESFKGFPKELALRPSQLYTSGQEAGLMLMAAASMRRHFQPFSFPVVLFAGTGDQVVDAGQSVWLQRRIPGSVARLLPLQGHMLHHTAGREIAETIVSMEHRERG